MKRLEKGEIISKNKLTEDVYSLEIALNAEDVKAGQFCSIYVNSPKHILPRPISISEATANAIVVVFQVLGEGTKILSQCKVGDVLNILIPLGNGYTIENKVKVALVGGGIGVPPLVQLEKEILKSIKNVEIDTYIGFRSTPFLDNKFTNVNISTDDGSVGFKGNVLELLKSSGKTYDIIYACGPHILLKNLAKYANENNISCQISMEERMACSIGACVGCVVSINGEYKKVCVDGPVFNSTEVDF
ncbi:MAG: dihydroorotate dehydrogenase electron transfer subunit [Lachnospirales bacterium]